VVELREAVYEDCAIIAALHAESWQRAYRGILSDDFLDHFVLEDRLAVWSERFSAPKKNQRIVCLKLREELIGFVCAYFSEDEKFGTFIDNLHVSHRMKRNGFGALLVDQITSLSQSEFGESMVYLWVLAENRSAVKFYESIGGKRYEALFWDSPDGGKYKKFRYVWC